MRSNYVNVKLNVTDNQKAKIKKALSSGADSVSIRFNPENCTGEDVIALTKSQVNKLKKACELGKGVTIRMSKTQLKHNMKIEGGFLPLIAGLAAKALPILTGTVLPALATGALSGLASTGTSKLLGSGLYLKKGGSVCKMIPQGHGLYLKPYQTSDLDKQGDGLYIKSGNKFVDGRGLLLGQNNPISKAIGNLPVIGKLLETIL